MPLLNWPREREATRLETQRADLLARIERLKPRSYARIIAEAELRALTHRALRLERAPPETPTKPEPSP